MMMMMMMMMKCLSPFLNNAAWQIKIKIILTDFYRIGQDHFDPLICFAYYYAFRPECSFLLTRVFL